jgi:polysaccharide export outer membrane protein
LAALAGPAAGCTGSGDFGTVGPAEAPRRIEAMLAQNNAPYRLGPGDKLRIIVFNEEQLSGEHTVDPNGAINVPLAGNLRAEGETVEQLTETLTTRLRGPILRDPKVSVQVLQTRPFYVLGEVTRAGEFPYRPGLSIASAIALAGGFSYRANQRRIFISRQGDAGEVPMPVNSGVYIAPGDVLRVGEGFL